MMEGEKMLFDRLNGNILTNYEGTPFYNKRENQWLLDFPREIKDEFLSLIEQGGDYEKLCCIFAEPNISYNTLMVFKSLGILEYSVPIEYCFSDVAKTHSYTKDDMAFLHYKLAQLLTKHENMPFKIKSDITYLTLKFMMYHTVDLVDDIGDVYNYDVTSLDKVFMSCTNEGINVFMVDKFIKNKHLNKLIHKHLFHLHSLDSIIQIDYILD